MKRQDWLKSLIIGSRVGVMENAEYHPNSVVSGEVCKANSTMLWVSIRQSTYRFRRSDGSILSVFGPTSPRSKIVPLTEELREDIECRELIIKIYSQLYGQDLKTLRSILDLLKAKW